ncbi:hypothetical protein F53441_14228 [Fusarium austroafricanum]|uniref:Uncharacterized protein n=1 Tax=Fusarium austroafricanum TaxID=2364996 RepID=A0A8H4JIC0_9HYPO|nr:hypothetical protein F53441_14228 [Fusarium austroafricanum]
MPSGTVSSPIKPRQTPTPPARAQSRDSYFTYKKECRLAWIKYLGLLGKVKLRDGPDGLPFFIGMPPEYSTSRILPEPLAAMQEMALSNPRNSLICLDDVLITLRQRPAQTHIAWHAIHQKLTDARTKPTVSIINESLNPKAILPAMNRLVGIRTMEQDPASCPGYILPMASFEKAIWNGDKATIEAQRKQYADIALRSLRKFMDRQKNEAIIEKMMEFQRHYETMAALETAALKKAGQGGK